MPKRSTRTRSTAKPRVKSTTKGTAKPTAKAKAKAKGKAITRATAKPPAMPTAKPTALPSAPSPQAARPDRESIESKGELGRRTRDDSTRQAALGRGVLAKHSMRPRIAPRANNETRRSGKRTVSTRARRRSH